MSIDVNFKQVGNGFKEALDTLKKMPVAVAQAIEKKGIKAALQPIYDEVVRRVPVGETGNLAKGIRIRFKVSGMNKLRGEVVSMAPHSHLVEFGHKIVRVSKSGKRTVSDRTAPPHPFFRPAFQGREDQILGIIENHVHIAITKFERKGK